MLHKSPYMFFDCFVCGFDFRSYYALEWAKEREFHFADRKKEKIWQNGKILSILTILTPI